MLKFAICDDEPLMAQEITNHLAVYMEENQAGAYSVSGFSSGAALLKSEGGFDVIFLDIQMEHPDGMETARLLRGQGNRSILIFVTVLKECVFDAFEVEAHDYLTKPLDSARFKRTMDRVFMRLAQASTRSIVIQKGAACQVVPLEEIVYCEVLGRKMYLHRTGGEVTEYYGRMEDLESRVDRRFFKCHRSYLVNLDCVRGCRDGQALLVGGKTIPVSRLREREFTQALLRRMKEEGG